MGCGVLGRGAGVWCGVNRGAYPVARGSFPVSPDRRAPPFFVWGGWFVWGCGVVVWELYSEREHLIEQDESRMGLCGLVCGV